MKIHKLTQRLAIVFLLIVASSWGFELQAQNGRPRPVRYEEVRDSLFPDYVAGVANGWGVGIWYMPCQGKELQFTMTETSEKETEVLLYIPEKDSLRDQFEAFIKLHPDARMDQVYPAMKVKKQVLPLSTAEIRSLRQEILDVMERSVRIEKSIWPVPGRRWTYRIHPKCVGDSYTMRFDGASYLTLSNGINQYTPEPPFVTWMKEKRPLFEKWAESKKE